MWTRGEPAVRRDLFGGKGEVRVWDLLRGSPIAPFTAVLSCELAPGGNVGAHVQQEFPEIVLCLEGHGSARVGMEVHSLSPGALVPLVLGMTLAITNESADAPLRYLIIKARAL